MWKDDEDQAPQPAVALRLWTEGRPIISPGTGGIHQSIRRLTPHPWPRLAFAAIADRPFASPRNGARQGSGSLREGEGPPMGTRTSIPNASRCGALATEQGAAIEQGQRSGEPRARWIRPTCAWWRAAAGE